MRTRYKKNAETGQMDTSTREIPICMAASAYFKHCVAIDRFNRVRQDGIRKEFKS